MTARPLLFRMGRRAPPAALAALGGCSRSPSQDILGSFFPSWMLCLGLGLLAAVLCRLAFSWIGFRDDVPVPLLTYLALAFAVTCLLWLLWFGH